MSLLSNFAKISLSATRTIHQTIPVGSSVFMKRQKKIDPEVKKFKRINKSSHSQVAKQREARRRKRLEKEIRHMQKHSKKPKPVDEMTLDVKSAKNIEWGIQEICSNFIFIFSENVAGSQLS